MDLIELGPHNFDKYGFARFCYPGEYEEEGEGLIREVKLPDGSMGLNTVKMIFQRSDLVLLSPHPANKLIDQDYFKLMPLGQKVPAMYLLAQRAGWNQTLEDLKILTGQAPTSHLATAEIQGIMNPLGSGLVLNVGSALHWIGMILVHPELRRQGVATAIMHQCLKEARLTQPAMIVGLDATPEGSHLYKRLGFRGSFRIWRSRLRTNAEIEVDRAQEINNIESTEKMLEVCSDLEIQMKLEGLSLIHKLNPEGSWVAKSGKKTVGLIMTRPGRLMPLIGPLVAESPASARTLLKRGLSYWQQQGVHEVFIDTPENNFSAASLWENEYKCLKPPESHILTPEIKPERAFIRMYQVITDEIFDQFTKWNTSFNKNTGRIRVIELGKEARKTTLDYMDREVRALNYIYASGGPEMS